MQIFDLTSLPGQTVRIFIKGLASPQGMDFSPGSINWKKWFFTGRANSTGTCWLSARHRGAGKLIIIIMYLSAGQRRGWWIGGRQGQPLRG